jgi:hypothetical protein
MTTEATKPTTNPTPPPLPEHILQFFAFAHLPERLQRISRPFCELAYSIVGETAEGVAGLGRPVPHDLLHLARNPERTVALRKLLEAKDAAVRAALAK